MIVVVEPDPLSQEALRGAAGSAGLAVPDLDAAGRRVQEADDVTVVLIGPHVDLESALALSEQLRLSKPMVGVVLVRPRIDTATLTDALRAGVREVVKERDIDGIAAAVQRAVAVSNAVREQAGLSVGGGDGEPGGR